MPSERAAPRRPPPPVSPIDGYIARAPAALRPSLTAVRSAIRSVAPDAIEVISYRMPGFSYPGYRYKGMFVWFGLQPHHLGLYLRPPTIENHAQLLAGYGTTLSAVHLPLDRKIPTALVRTLAKASARIARRPEMRLPGPKRRASAAR